MDLIVYYLWIIIVGSKIACLKDAFLHVAVHPFSIMAVRFKSLAHIKIYSLQNFAVLKK